MAWGKSRTPPLTVSESIRAMVAEVLRRDSHKPKGKK